MVCRRFGVHGVTSQKMTVFTVTPPGPQISKCPSFSWLYSYLLIWSLGI